MSRQLFFVGGLLLSAAAASVHAQDRQNGSTAPDYKVVIWYDKSDPAGTFQYKAYDMRASQYSKDVDAWVRQRAEAPGKMTYVKEVNMSQDYGGYTEKEKLDNAIKLEKQRAISSKWIQPDWVDTPSMNLNGPKRKENDQPPAKRDQIVFDDSAKKNANNTLTGATWIPSSDSC